MYAKATNFFVYFLGAWYLSGRFLLSALLAGITTALAFLEYGWATVQWFGIALLISAFLKVSGLVPFWPV